MFCTNELNDMVADWNHLYLCSRLFCSPALSPINSHPIDFNLTQSTSNSCPLTISTINFCPQYKFPPSLHQTLAHSSSHTHQEFEVERAGVWGWEFMVEIVRGREYEFERARLQKGWDHEMVPLGHHVERVGHRECRGDDETRRWSHTATIKWRWEVIYWIY